MQANTNNVTIGGLRNEVFSKSLYNCMIMAVLCWMTVHKYAAFVSVNTQYEDSHSLIIFILFPYSNNRGEHDYHVY